MVKQIPLPRGYYALVDDECYEYLNQWKWNIDIRECKTCDNLYYARRLQHLGYVDGKQKQKVIQMHQLITGFPKGIEVDHINGNGLDNRKENLRLVTHRENMQNLTKNKTNSSMYPGVYWDKEKRKWRARFKVKEKQHHIGYFEDELEAAEAYKESVKKLE